MEDLPLDLIPPSWLAAAHEWAPWALGALVLATIAVRLLLPLARAVERWAITTPAAWDDGPSRRVVVALEWAAGASAAILALIPRLTIGDPSRRPVPEPMPQPQPPRRDGADTLLALGLAIVVGASALTSGCGASAIGMHARAALVTTSVVQVSGEALDVARDASLDHVQAEHATAPAEVHDAAVRAEAARWRPVGAALDAVRSALLTWIQAVDLARIAGEEDVSLGALVPIAVRVVDLYGRVAALARELGADVPLLPEWLTGLLGVALPARAGGAS